MKTKIVQRESLIAIIKQLKNEGKRVISTSGCFDILHAGHVQYLREAKAKGDILVIMLNSDVSVRMLKGASRPIVCQEDRAYVLEALEMVDYICIFDEQTPCELIRQIQPDAVIKVAIIKENIFQKWMWWIHMGNCRVCVISRKPFDHKYYWKNTGTI